MTAPEWRDCADPDELAAAVAAGVEVLRMRGGGSRGVSGETLPEHLAELVHEASVKLGCAESAVWAYLAQHAVIEHAAAIEREQANR